MPLLAYNSAYRLSAIRPQLASIYFFKGSALRQKSRRRDSQAELIVMLEGTYTARYPGKGNILPLVARAGDVVFWPAGTDRIEENDPARPMQCYAIHLRWAQAPTTLPRRVSDESGIMRYFAAQMIAIKESPVSMPPGIPNAFLAALLAEYVRRAMIPTDPLEAKVIAFLSRHRAAPFNLDQLARFVGLERHHFGRIFKTRTGYAPMDYVRRKRLSWAVNLIGGVPGISTQAIAERVGVRDGAELLRQLRRYNGWGKRTLQRMLKAGAPLPPIFPGHDLIPV